MNSIEAKDAVEAVASERLERCNVCPNNSKNSNKLIALLPAYCRLCNCNLDWKTHSLSSECPDTPPRWNAIPDISDDESNRIDEIVGND